MKPSDAPFWVKRDGSICAKNGTFSGKLEAATGSFAGSINVANNFIVDSEGNVEMTGGLISYSEISSPYIESPEIYGDEIYASSAFLVGSNGEYGSFGYATGKKITSDGTGTETSYGVAMAASNVTVEDGIINFDSGGCYFIATEAGVRMQAPGHSLVVTSTGAFYDGEEIGQGVGGVAVFG